VVGTTGATGVVETTGTYGTELGAYAWVYVHLGRLKVVGLETV